MTNEFLTKKATQGHWWDMPIILSGGFLDVLLVVVTIEELAKKDYFMTILASFLLLALFSWPMALVLRRRKRQRDARKLASTFATWRFDEISAADLERKSGVANAAKRAGLLIVKGFLQNADVDFDRNVVRIPVFGKIKTEGSVKKTVKPEPVPEKPVDAPADVYDAKLREIRKLNDDIAHVAVSEKIDRIESLTADIFRIIREKPGRKEDAHKFLNYYLPTTLKLLESYRLMERQGYQSETITESRNKIESTLDMLITAIAEQRDKMLRADVLDMDTDITVLETMIASDGLTGQRGFGLKL